MNAADSPPAARASEEGARLLRRLRGALLSVAEPAKAPAMQAYMKSAMPYLGVQTPAFRKVCATVFADLELADGNEWRALVLDVWRGAEYREERYAAVELSGHKRARAFQTPTAMPMYEELIVAGAWWDFVDNIASHRVGPILASHPKPMRRKMLAWSRSADLWKRRTAILCQLTFKHATDLDLLYDCLEPSLDSKEFFLRKAIGWALRQYAWSNPEEVRRYVAANRGRLSALSYREATKNLGPAGLNRRSRRS